MSRPMSVSMTLDAVRDQTKTVTRRHVDTWQNLTPGDRLTLIEKGMGLPKGAKQVVVCEVEVVDVRVETLNQLTADEVRAEGLWDRALTECHGVTAAVVPWFAAFWAEGHGYRPKAIEDLGAIPCRRIEWRYLSSGEAPQ